MSVIQCSCCFGWCLLLLIRHWKSVGFIVASFDTAHTTSATIVNATLLSACMLVSAGNYTFFLETQSSASCLWHTGFDPRENNSSLLLDRDSVCVSEAASSTRSSQWQPPWAWTCKFWQLATIITWKLELCLRAKDVVNWYKDRGNGTKSNTNPAHTVHEHSHLPPHSNLN